MILVDFRGIDTLGEIAVVVLAGLCVLALIRVRTKPDKTVEASEQDAVKAKQAEAI